MPARGGSKGIPDKNLRPLAGRSLIAHAAAAARASGVVDRIVLTTDSPQPVFDEILRAAGVPLAKKPSH